MASKISSIGLGAGKRFREKFQHVGKDVLNYFPGHMSKGMQQMQKVLTKIDCILEVHDARIPFSGRNPRFSDTLAVRPRILILNKMDLVSMKHHKEIEERLTRDEGIRKVLYTCCKENMDVSIKHKIIPAVTELIESGDRYDRAEEEHFNVLVIGVPNVGKSSLINALRSMHLNKVNKATPVGARPGVTRSLMEKIKVSENPRIYVFDTPGIMSPNIPDMDVGMKLALCGNLKEHLVGIVTVADYLVFWLNKHSNFKYVPRYGMDEPNDDVYQVLTFIAKQHNLVQKIRSPSGGYVFRPNFSRAAEIILDDFRTGFLGKVNLDEDRLLVNRAFKNGRLINEKLAVD